MSDKLKVSKVESKGYGNIYKLPMLDRDLDVVAKAFYAYLCSFAGQGETAFPGIDKICHDLNVSKSRLERHRKALIEKGYITVNQIKEKGRFSRNEYHINKELVPYTQNEPTEIACTENEPTQNEGINKNSINKNNNNKNNNKKNKRHKYEICDMDNAKLLFELMIINNDTHKEPNFEDWANTFRLMRENDGRTNEQIQYVIKWSQKDEFWKVNVLSARNIRENFAKYVGVIKKQRENKGGYNNGWNERPNGKPSVKETFGTELEF